MTASAPPPAWHPFTLLGRLLYGFAWILGGVLYRIPFSLKRAGAGWLARAAYFLFPGKTRVILQNLVHVFPRLSEEAMDDFRRRTERLAFEHYSHLSLSFLEVLERFHWTAETVETRVRIHDFAVVGERTARREGYFILTAHLGNWELLTLVTVIRKIPLAIVTRYLRNPFFDALWVRSRKSYGLDLLEEKGSGLGIIRRIKLGGVVGFIMDQHTGEPHGVRAKFFGLDAWTPKGLAILSDRLRAAIIPGYMIRATDGTFDVHVDAALDVSALDTNPVYRNESGALTEAGILYHVQLCNENMERWIRKAPAQYLWIHRRFKEAIDYRAPLVWE